MKSALTVAVSLVALFAGHTAGLAFSETQWQMVNTNGRTAVSGKTTIGGTDHYVSFSCETLPGTWSPSHWNAAKQLEMYVSAGVPAPPSAPAGGMFGAPNPLDSIKGLDGKPLFGVPETRVSNGDERVTIMVRGGAITLARDEFMPSDSRLLQPADSKSLPELASSRLMPGYFDPGYHTANIKVTGRIRDVVLHNPQLQIRFGDPAKPAYSFLSDLSAGSKLISDFDDNCK